MEEKRNFHFSFFPAGDSQKSNRVFWKVYAWLGLSVKLGTLFFHRLVSSRLAEICAESQDLQSEHGFRACSFEHKRRKLDFHISGGEQNKKKRNEK